MEGATHKQVVDLIKSGGDVLTLTVISVTAQEAERLEPAEEVAGYNYFDYSEKRSLPISIPDYHYVEKNGDKFVVSNHLPYSLKLLKMSQVLSCGLKFHFFLGI